MKHPEPEYQRRMLTSLPVRDATRVLECNLECIPMYDFNSLTIKRPFQSTSTNATYFRLWYVHNARNWQSAAYLMFTPRSKEMLSICTQIRDVIIVSLARSNSAFLIGLRCLVQCFTQKSTDPFITKLKPILDSIYNKNSSNHFLSQWIKCFQRLKKSDIQILIRIMQGPWMRSVC